MSIHVLIVDDEPDIREVLAESLSEVGFETTACASGEEALAALDAHVFDVVITDVRMPAIDGIDLCTRITSNHGIPVIVMTAFGETSAAVDALRAAAVDFITKPFDLDAMVAAIHSALAKAKRTPLRRLAPASREMDFSALVGESPAMRALVDRLARVAPADASVLVTGESGTGKELVARALHQNGARSSGPFVAVSCAAMPAQLLESELFGCERGAYTGATQSRQGLLVQASGGTLFLDEVGAMPLELQPAFLRVLQERVVRPVGGTREESFDVRVIAASNRDLEAAVREGTFRNALLFRLAVLAVRVPPLREREGDVLVLANHFLRRHAEETNTEPLVLSEEAGAALSAHAWRGNVRELQNCMQAVVALARSNVVHVSDLPEEIRRGENGGPSPLDPTPSLGDLKQEQIERVLRAVGGNKAEAARVLGIDRVTLYRRMKRSNGDRPAR